MSISVDDRLAQGAWSAVVGIDDCIGCSLGRRFAAQQADHNQADSQQTQEFGKGYFHGALLIYFFSEDYS